MTDIFSLKVEEIVSKIKDAQLTSVEVCKKYIERINKFEKEVKAWAYFDKKLLSRHSRKLQPLNFWPMSLRFRFQLKNGSVFGLKTKGF